MYFNSNNLNADIITNILSFADNKVSLAQQLLQTSILLNGE